MIIRLDPRSGEPIYTQIVDQIKLLAAAGKLRANDQLPTVRQLASDLRVNANTVARAYALLAEEGIISTQPGRGTYVLGPPAPLDQRRLRRERLKAMLEAVLGETRRLGYEADEVEKVWSELMPAWRRLLKRGD